jgi:DNA modification methylase
MAALHAGETTVPVSFQDYESPEQEYADVIADNEIARWSELDIQGVNLDLGDLGPDFDLDLLGIDGFALDILPPEPQCDEDEMPEHVEPKAKLGDIYKLGNHRLLCGDATSPDAVDALMNGEKADMVFTDPPYNTGMKAKKGSQSKTRLGHMFEDDFTDEAWAALLSGMCASYWMATKDSAALYICLDWRRSHELVPEIKKLFKFSNLIVWDKMFHGLGSDYKYTHEFIHVCKKGDPVLETNHGEKDYKDIWHIQRKIGRDDEHATKKPIEIVERAITHATQQGQSVLDLFGGSGSTLIACEKTNRKCYMMELDPKYCDVIVARWEKYTGGKAELLNGQA